MMRTMAGPTRRFTATVVSNAKRRVLVPLPFAPDDAWGHKPSHPVAGSVNGMGVRAVVEAIDDGWAIVLGPAWRRDCGIAPGDEVDVVLYPEGPQRDDLAEDIAAALAAEPDAAAFFDGLAQFYRRAYLRWIDATKRRPDLRAERIVEVVNLLKAGIKEPSQPMIDAYIKATDVWWSQCAMRLALDRLLERLRGTVLAMVVLTLVDAAGPPGPWRLVALAPGIIVTIAFIRRSYALSVLGISTVAVLAYAQVSAPLGEALLWRGLDTLVGAAIAIVIMVLVIPIMVWNIRPANKESGGPCPGQFHRQILSRPLRRPHRGAGPVG